MPDAQPAPNPIRPVEYDSHAFNAIYLTYTFLGIKANEAPDGLCILHDAFYSAELLIEMTAALSKFECSYPQPPWNDLIAMDWETLCSVYCKRVITYILSEHEWPEFDTLIRACALTTEATCNG